MYRTTLCYLINGTQWLMLLRNKKKDDINKGKWIGVGGKIETGETADACARREIFEETGLVADELNFRGMIHFYFEDDTEVCHVYTCERYHGEIHECNEGTLRWIEKDEILSLPLWEGDRLFLRRLFEGDFKEFHLGLTYDRDGRLIHVDEGENV